MSMEKFVKVRNVGKGNMGSCALVRNTDNGKYYVVKQVDLSKMNKRERQQSLNEAHLLKSLRHPNIIQYEDSFLSRRSNHLCIVMEHADSGDLSNRIKKTYGVNFREPQVLDWLIQLVLSLSHIHQRKILHRDVKSQNVFLTGQNILKLGDFGIARTLGGTYDQAKTFVGTPYYLSPELILERPYDHRSDVWALGVLVYELLTLKHPFNANNMRGLMQRILEVQYDPIPQLYTTEMRNIVSRLLVKDPAQRIKLDDLLELPIVQRRMREWMLGDIMPKDYIETLLQDGLLPPAIAALRKPSGTTVDDPQKQQQQQLQPQAQPQPQRQPQQQQQQLGLPSLVPSGDVNVKDPSAFAAFSTPSDAAIPSRPTGKVLSPMPQQKAQEPSFVARRSMAAIDRLRALQPPKRPQPLYFMYKNINPRYYSPNTQSKKELGARPSAAGLPQVTSLSRFQRQAPAQSPSAGVVSEPLSSEGRELSRVKVNAGAAAVSAGAPSFPLGSNPHATGGACVPQNECNNDRSALPSVTDHRVHKRSHQESNGVALCLNPFFQVTPENPAPLPYLSGVSQTDIKAMLQRAALERARLRPSLMNANLQSERTRWKAK